FEDWVHAEAEKHRGWRALDSVSDLARTHRCAFTLNIKPGVHRLCRPIWASDAYYDLDLIEELAIEGIRAAVPRSDAIKQAAARDAVMSPETLEQLDEAWWIETNERARRKLKTEEVEDVAANPAAIHAGCAFIRHAYDFADTLSEPEWFAALTILGRTFGGDIV